MLSDVRETFRTVNIFVNKEKCLFLYLWTCGYLSYTVGIKGGGGGWGGGGGGFPSEIQSLLQRYTITIYIYCPAFLPAQASDTCYEAANNKSNSLSIS